MKVPVYFHGKRIYALFASYNSELDLYLVDFGISEKKGFILFSNYFLNLSKFKNTFS